VNDADMESQFLFMEELTSKPHSAISVAHTPSRGWCLTRVFEDRRDWELVATIVRLYETQEALQASQRQQQVTT
jgi:hypothetical protein